MTPERLEEIRDDVERGYGASENRMRELIAHIDTLEGRK